MPPKSGSARTWLIVPAIVAIALTLNACGSDGATSTSQEATKVSTETLHPADFGDPATGANPYLPLVPGTQTVRRGTTRVGGRSVPHIVTSTITGVEREIEGVRTVVQLDHEVDGGEVTQVSLDYVAEDLAGNVWNLGGYTEEYEGGRFVSGVDPWLAGANGANAGILVQANPRTETPVYSVSQPDREEDSVAEVIDVGIEHCVPFDCFAGVLVVREGKASAPDNEFKYYARDVGQIDNVPRDDSVHKDVERLVNLRQLSPRELAEIDRDALRIDHRAPRQAPAIFGGLPVARQG